MRKHHIFYAFTFCGKAKPSFLGSRDSRQEWIIRSSNVGIYRRNECLIFPTSGFPASANQYFHETEKSEIANLFYFWISENKKPQMHSISSFLKTRGRKFNPFLPFREPETGNSILFLPFWKSDAGNPTNFIVFKNLTQVVQKILISPHQKNQKP